MKRSVFTLTLLTALLGSAALAQNAPLPAIPDDAPVYGAQLMTPQERLEHMRKMRAASTLQQREQIRAEHHAQMVERAKAQGITLPDEPPVGGRMMGGGYRGGR